jgi:hypothetical protein
VLRLQNKDDSRWILDFNLLKTDLFGKILWAKAYNTVYWGFDMDRDGNMIQAGHTRKSPLSKNWDVEITKVDPKGMVLWTEYFGQPRDYDGKWIHDEAWGARATPDGGWLVVAGTGDETGKYEGHGHPSGRSGQWKVYLIKTDSMGNLEWEGVYGTPHGDWAGEDVCLTRDGEISHDVSRRRSRRQGPGGRQAQGQQGGIEEVILPLFPTGAMDSK